MPNGRGERTTAGSFGCLPDEIEGNPHELSAQTREKGRVLLGASAGPRFIQGGSAGCSTQPIGEMPNVSAIRNVLRVSTMAAPMTAAAWVSQRLANRPMIPAYPAGPTSSLTWARA